METYFPPRKDAALNEVVLDVLNASMGNADVEGNNRSTVDLLLVSTIESKKAQVEALLGEILALEKIEQERKNKASKEINIEKAREKSYLRSQMK